MDQEHKRNLLNLRNSYAILFFGNIAMLGYDFFTQPLRTIPIVYLALLAAPLLIVAFSSAISKQHLAIWSVRTAWTLGVSVAIHVILADTSGAPLGLGFETIFSSAGFTLLLGWYVSKPYEVEQSLDD